VHPFTEAMGSIVADLPIKLAASAAFNIVLYFLAGLVSSESCEIC
jgi:ABC-type multidrug transport system permease subunit